MKQTFIILTAIITVFAISACSFVGPMPAAVYTGMESGEFQDNNIETKKEGEACAKNVMMIATWGDASIRAAKKDGGIKKVATIDHKSFSVLVYGEYCTIVKGE